VIEVVVTPVQISPFVDLRMDPLSPTATNRSPRLSTPRRFCEEYLLVITKAVPKPEDPCSVKTIVPAAPTATPFVNPPEKALRS